jgi:hypothetical protein
LGRAKIASGHLGF